MAREAVQDAEEYLEMLENSGASQDEIIQAQSNLSQAKMNLEQAKAQLERIRLENESNIDALKKNIKTIKTKIDGSIIQDESTEVMISGNIDALGYKKSLSEKGYLEAQNSLLLLNNQRIQELNAAEHDIELLKKPLMLARFSSVSST